MMTKSTNIILDKRPDDCTPTQIYGAVSEVIRSALLLLEMLEDKHSSPA